MSTITRLSGRALSALLPPLARTGNPLPVTLADAVTSLLMDGRIAPGTKLPSERELATTLQLSRSTITTAYDHLRENGLLTSRSGSGSVTALPNVADPAPSTPDASRWRQNGIGASGLETTADDAGYLDLSRATVATPAELGGAVQRAARRLPEHSRGDGYEPAGISALRRAVAARFTERGVVTRPEQILVTNGALHALDLIMRLLCSPGDRVVTELPTYSGLLDVIRANGARAAAVPVSPDGGWQVDALSAALDTRPRLVALIPDYHNPTGMLVPDDQRREIVRTARRHQVSIVVDESFVELGFAAPATPMAALDPSVITVGSVSKPLWGGLRIGWVRASADLIARLVVVRAAIDMGQSIFDQLTAVELFAELDVLTARRRAELRAHRDALTEALTTTLPQWRVRRPEGGMSMWVELDAPLATALSMQAARHNLRIVPGSRFGPDATLERFLRLPYAAPVDVLREAVRRLAGAWSELDAATGRYAPLIVA